MHAVEKLEAFVNNSDAMQQEINLQRLRVDAAEVTAKGKRSAATTAETLAPTEEEREQSHFDAVPTKFLSIPLHSPAWPV